MTLREKFKEILTAFWINDWEDECEKVADEFAIEFAEWCCARAIGVTYFKLNEKELEQFKKEREV
jgi:hypothetical protein